MAMPWGLLKEALSPNPSTEAEDPDPAKVVTKPDDDILRILLFETSVWNISPPELITMALGLLKEAAVLKPSADPIDPDPAMVTTLNTPAIMHFIDYQFLSHFKGI